MNIFEWKKLSNNVQERYLRRSEDDIEASFAVVRPIITEVKKRGDAALREYVSRFDGANIEALPIQATAEEFQAAEQSLNVEVKEALAYAIANVTRFHRGQVDKGLTMRELRPGIFVGERYSPIDSVGLYVPRGRGSFPSMLYMLAVPAMLAGVPHVSVATPPQPDGKIDAACLYAAQLCGVNRVYRMGGGQAIAAFAYGTESVQAVCKVTGPGGTYVNAAKRLLAHVIAPGLPAGPSESIIVADAQADPRLVTLDLFIEAEHGSDSAAILITDSLQLAEAVKERGEQYLQEIPEPRQSFVRDVFNGYGAIFLTDSMAEAFQLANDFAAEHLQIQTSNPQNDLKLVKHAGEILLGQHTPFTVANYAAGANAVLPTGGKARTWSALSVLDFMKSSSVVQLSAAGYRELEKHCRVLANYEGFFTHHEAMARRSHDSGQ